MENNSALKKYIPLVDFLAAACGSSFEVVLHDTSKPKTSIIAIRNGHLTGRRIGDSVTDFASKINNGEYAKSDYIANYEGRLKNGKMFVSSSYFIKENGRVIGVLCINHDTSELFELNRQVSQLMRSFSIIPEESAPALKENLDASISNLSTSIIDTTISNYTVEPDRLTADEKQSIVKALEDQGVFATKGAVCYVAEALRISKPTVYRYLNQIRSGKVSAETKKDGVFLE